MRHPWNFDPDWEESASTYYNLTHGGPGWDDYVDTLSAYYYNSMKVPSFAGFAILIMFGAVVIAATVQRILMEVPSLQRAMMKNRVIRTWRVKISGAPLFGHRHAEPLPLLGRFVSLKLPLRGESMLLTALLIVNLVPVVAFYRPFRRNNLYWSDAFVEIGRYLADRSGIIATAQFPPLILLSGRNNPVTWATGTSFETCMLYHRWFARLIFVQVLVHAIAYSVISVRSAGLAGYYSYFVDPYFRWGCVATVAFGPLIFLSLRYLRQKSYETFVLVHVVMAIICIVGTFYHIHLLAIVESGRFADFDNYIYASVFFYCMDKFARLVRIAVYSIAIRNKRLCISMSEATLLFQGDRSSIIRQTITLKGFAAHKFAHHTHRCGGRFVQLWLPRLQLLSSHPFTIADVSTTEEETTLYLYTKIHRGITKQIERRIHKAQTQSVKHYALVEGFYGHKPPMATHDSVLLVAAGIGITLCMPLFTQAMQSSQATQLVWVIPEMGMLHVIKDILSRCLDSSSSSMVQDVQTLDENESGADKVLVRKLEIYLTNAYIDDAILPINVLSATDEAEGEYANKTLTSSMKPVFAFDAMLNDKNDNDIQDGSMLKKSAVLSPAEKVSNTFHSHNADVTQSDKLQHAVQILSKRLGIDLVLHTKTIGHPCLQDVIRDTHKSISASFHQEAAWKGDMLVIGCGPDAFCDDVRSAAHTMRLPYCEEAFQW